MGLPKILSGDHRTSTKLLNFPKGSFKIRKNLRKSLEIWIGHPRILSADARTSSIRKLSVHPYKHLQLEGGDFQSLRLGFACI